LISFFSHLMNDLIGSIPNVQIARTSPFAQRLPLGEGATPKANVPLR
jgi:hypothetical protein